MDFSPHIRDVETWVMSGITPTKFPFQQETCPRVPQKCTGNRLSWSRHPTNPRDSLRLPQAPFTIPEIYTPLTRQRRQNGPGPRRAPCLLHPSAAPSIGLWQETNICSTPNATQSNPHKFNPQDRSKLLHLRRNVTQTNCTMMRRPLLAPCINKLPDWPAKLVPAIGIPDFQN